jgi:hypothetical protein
MSDLDEDRSSPINPQVIADIEEKSFGHVREMRSARNESSDDDGWCVRIHGAEHATRRSDVILC